MTTQPKPDPIFARIEKYRAAHEAVLTFPDCDMDGDNPKWEEAVGREMDLWLKLAETTPKTLAGLSAFIEYIATESGMENEFGNGGFYVLESIAKAWRALGLDPRLNEAADGEAA